MSKRDVRRLELLLQEFEAKRDLPRKRIMHILGLDIFDPAAKGQFTQFMALAKDLGIQRGLRIVPVLERRDWWTAAPTDDVALLAAAPRLLAGKTEWTRRHLGYRGLPVSGTLALAAKNQMAALADTLDALRPARDRDDACLARIDARINAAS